MDRMPDYRPHLYNSRRGNLQGFENRFQRPPPRPINQSQFFHGNLPGRYPHHTSRGLGRMGPRMAPPAPLVSHSQTHTDNFTRSRHPCHQTGGTLNCKDGSLFSKLKNNEVPSNSTSDQQSPAKMVKNDTNYDINVCNMTGARMPIRENWIQQWLDDKMMGQRESNNSCTESSLNANLISELKTLLRKAADITNKLKAIQLLLKDEAFEENRTDADVENLLQQANILKTQLHNVKGQISSREGLYNTLHKKIDKARKRRARIKRKRAREWAENESRDKERQEKHREIDDWQAKIYEQVQETKMEKELGEIADKTLGEVRRKLSDTSRGLSVLATVAKLRQARKHDLTQQGLYVSKTSDVLFNQRHQELVELMTSQLRTYQHEQRLLQVMLDCEKAELAEHDEEERQRRREERHEQIYARLHTHLFGTKEEPGNPLSPHQVFYSAAELSAQHLITIRREWDAFLVADDHPTGSSLPQGWVVPVAPSSDTWASALKIKPEPT